jgi:hypothetical protein
MSRSLLPLLAVLLVGCGVTEETFAYEFAKLSCKKAQRCDREDFEDWYDDLDDCIDDVEPVWELIQDGAEFLCEIDYQIASRCYRQLRNASCDEWDDEDYNPEACEDYVVCD